MQDPGTITGKRTAGRLLVRLRDEPVEVMLVIALHGRETTGEQT